MNDDCVRRDEVMTIVARKHLFKDKSDFDKCVHTIAKQIKALPSVQPKAKLIPVSKMLPKAGEYVGNIPKYYLVQNEFGDMLVARYTHSEYWEQIYQHKPIADEIVAWCELPELYRSESEEI